MNVQATTGMTKPETLLKIAAERKAAAERIDTSETETVSARDLREGDVVTELNGVVFPFPFTMTSVRPVCSVVMLKASHGWFSVPAIPATAAAVRVL